MQQSDLLQNNQSYRNVLLENNQIQLKGFTDNFEGSQSN